MADDWLQTLDGAAWNADLVTLNRLLEAGVDPNATTTGKTALMEVVDEPAEWFTPTHHAILVRLLEAGADVNAVDPADGLTALHYAVGAGEDPVRLLLDAGADPSAAALDGTTALHHCVEECGLAVARLLIAAGCNPDARRRDGASPLDLARAEAAAFPDEEADALVRLLEEARD